MADAAEGVQVTMEVEEQRTWIRIEGERKVAVIVESASGERIYLPPEDFAGGADDEAGRTPYDSPYDASAGGDTPYESAAGGTPYESADDPRAGAEPIGVESTADGFRVLHPEPVHDVRLLR